MTLGPADVTLAQLLAVASGGQIIRRMAIRQMGLPEGFGTAAFEYPMVRVLTSVSDTI